MSKTTGIAVGDHDAHGAYRPCPLLFIFLRVRLFQHAIARVSAEDIMYIRFWAASLLLVMPYSLQAADEAEPIIVTATRTAQTADETLAAVTVITRAEIERQQATSVQDLLLAVPGLSLVNNGGLGKTTSVFLRGTGADHVVVLIDGIKVGSATSGTTAFQDIPVGQIERIEIVRGPRSSLYGSEAIGGVIQIFTRKGGGAFAPSFSRGVGSHQTYTDSAGVSGGGEHGWYSMNTSGISSEGFNAYRGSEPDNDGYRNRSNTLRAGYRLDKTIEIDMHALHARSENEYDGFTNEGKSTQQVMGGRLRLSPTTFWQANLTAGRSRDESDNFLNGVFQSKFDTERDSVSLQNDFLLGTRNIFTLGFDYQEDRVTSTTAYTLNSRDNRSVFGQYQGMFGIPDIQVAVRGDNNEHSGHHTTGSLALGFNLGAELRLVASSGSAFKVPNFNDLFYPGYSNPNLLPEESLSHEVGLQGKMTHGRWSLNLYQTDIDNLIESNPPTYLPYNTAIAQLRGVEAVYKRRIGGLEVGTNLTLQDPRNRSPGPNNGNVLRQRAMQLFNLDLDYNIRQVRIGGTLHAEGKSYADAENTDELHAYATVDLRAEYEFAKGWSVGGRIGNLFNEAYETVKSYNQDGRNYFVTLRYRPT